LYKATGIFNFAQGELLTLGAYVAYWGIHTLGLPSVAAFVVSFILLFGVGVVFERVAYAPLRKQSFLVVVIATLGASIVIQGAISIWFSGGQPLPLSSPGDKDTVRVFGAVIAVQRIVIVVVTILALSAFGFLLYKTQIGRQFRALADDRETAQIQGIHVSRLSMIAFGLSAATSALGGVLIAPLSDVDPNMGFDIMLIAFAAAMIGGFGSLSGVVVGAVVLGLVESVLGGYFLPNFSAAYPYILMIVAIFFFPRGLFHGQAAERL
jgi:branched-chain amino acid transport system permease protein